MWSAAQVDERPQGLSKPTPVPFFWGPLSLYCATLIPPHLYPDPRLPSSGRSTKRSTSSAPRRRRHITQSCWVSFGANCKTYYSRPKPYPYLCHHLQFSSLAERAVWGEIGPATSGALQLCRSGARKTNVTGKQMSQGNKCNRETNVMTHRHPSADPFTTSEF